MELLIDVNITDEYYEDFSKYLLTTIKSQIASSVDSIIERVINNISKDIGIDSSINSYIKCIKSDLVLSKRYDGKNVIRFSDEFSNGYRLIKMVEFGIGNSKPSPIIRNIFNNHRLNMKDEFDAYCMLRGRIL